MTNYKHSLSKFQHQQDKKGSPPPAVKFCRTDGEKIEESWRGKAKRRRYGSRSYAGYSGSLACSEEEFLPTLRESRQTKQKKQTKIVSRTSLNLNKPLRSENCCFWRFSKKKRFREIYMYIFHVWNSEIFVCLGFYFLSPRIENQNVGGRKVFQ